MQQSSRERFEITVSYGSRGVDSHLILNSR